MIRKIHLIKIQKAVLWFILGFAFTSLVPTQIVTMDKYIVNVIFLSLCIIWLVTYFKNDFKIVVRNTKKFEYLLLIASLVIHAIVVYYILTFLDKPILPFNSTGASPLLMNNFFIWVKPLDVFVQQLLIILLVSKLHMYHMSIKHITALFVFGFGLIHIFQVFKTDAFVGIAFAVIAIIFSFIFPNMILKVRNGYMYNYLIHLGVYDLIALLVWLIF